MSLMQQKRILRTSRETLCLLRTAALSSRLVHGCAALLLLLASAVAAGAADVRDQVYAVGIGTRNIYLVNANGTVTSQFSNYSATASAAAAQRASDGMIFLITQVANGTVYSWNPATPATAPV
jgi:hypothetical protein